MAGRPGTKGLPLGTSGNGREREDDREFRLGWLAQRRDRIEQRLGWLQVPE